MNPGCSTCHKKNTCHYFKPNKQNYCDNCYHLMIVRNPYKGHTIHCKICLQFGNGLFNNFNKKFECESCYMKYLSANTTCYFDPNDLMDSETEEKIIDEFLKLVGV